MTIPDEVTIDEQPSRRPILPVPTSTVAFVGPAAQGPLDPTLVSSFVEFDYVYGGALDLPTGPNHLAHAARAFFANGGRRLWIARVADATDVAAYAAALASLRSVDGISVVAAPGVTADPALGDAVNALLIDHAEASRCRLALLDAAPTATTADVSAQRRVRDSSYAALYHPWVRCVRLDGAGTIDLPPSGFVAGVYARVDTNRGVWHAPANESLAGAADVAAPMSEAAVAELNAAGVSTLRMLPGRGPTVWGTRTMSGDDEFKYVPVRRTLLFLEESIARGLQWVVFEPNDEPLWPRVRLTVDDFLAPLWRAGGLRGTKPTDAYFARCDRTTMTQNDLDNGRLIVVVGVALLKPTEFIVFRLGFPTAAA